MKNITITLNEVSAKIVADTLEFYNLYMLEEAERQDPTKDNGYLIKAIKDFLEAYKGATK